MDFDYLRRQLDLPSGIEPPVPALVGGDSFVFLRTVGSRVSPDVQLLELYREVFFKSPVQKGAARPLTYVAGATPGEQAVLLLARGRVRQGGSSGNEFYAPVYPEQAAHAWLRGKTDRAIRDHLFCGPLWQYVNDEHSGRDVDHLYLTFVEALDGRRRRSAAARDLPEVLDLTSRLDNTLSPDVYFSDPKDAATRLFDHAEGYPHIDLPPHSPDPLAALIATDLRALSDLEATLPRLQWLELLKTFLRIATCSWVLAQTRITILIHEWCRTCLEGGAAPSLQEATAAIRARNQALFHPVNTGGDELEFHVQKYVRARVELTIMLRLCAMFSGADIDKRRLTINDPSRGGMTLDELCTTMVHLRSEFGRRVTGVSPVQAVLRIAERYSAWTRPRKEGQGKNLFEFLQVVVRLENTPEDEGYLVTRRSARGAAAGRDRIFPGPLLVRLITALAARKKRRAASGGGKLLLSDLEEHFSTYGVEFSSSAGARPLLIAELAQLGLLRGSPDAGDSAEIYMPAELAHA